MSSRAEKSFSNKSSRGGNDVPNSQATPDPLIAAARQGSVEALDKLIERLSEHLWEELSGRRRRRSPGLSHGSSDLIQDTLLRVRQQFDKFERDTFTDFKQWARSVLYHRRLEWTRNHQARHAEHHKRMIWELFHARAAEDNSGEAAHEICIAQRQEAERAYALFQSLKPHEQFVIELRLLNGQSYKQIAELTGSKEDAARMAYERALAKLRSRLKTDD